MRFYRIPLYCIVALVFWGCDSDEDDGSASTGCGNLESMCDEGSSCRLSERGVPTCYPDEAVGGTDVTGSDSDGGAESNEVDGLMGAVPSAGGADIIPTQAVAGSGPETVAGGMASAPGAGLQGVPGGGSNEGGDAERGGTVSAAGAPVSGGELGGVQSGGEVPQEGGAGAAGAVAVGGADDVPGGGEAEAGGESGGRQTVSFLEIGGEQDPDACNTIDCGLHGTCDDGLCTCTDGYTGPVCDQPPAGPANLREAMADDADGRFTTFIAAMEYSNRSPFMLFGGNTLFVPTNAALEAAGLTIENLESLEALEVANILDRHIVEGVVRGADLEGGLDEVVSRAGRFATVNGAGSVPLAVGGVPILEADAFSGGGSVAHILDGVLPDPCDLVGTIPSNSHCHQGIISCIANYEANGAGECIRSCIPSCGPNATCSDGDCQCDDGFVPAPDLEVGAQSHPGCLAIQPCGGLCGPNNLNNAICNEVADACECKAGFEEDTEASEGGRLVCSRVDACANVTCDEEREICVDGTCECATGFITQGTSGTCEVASCAVLDIVTLETGGEGIDEPLAPELGSPRSQVVIRFPDDFATAGGGSAEICVQLFGTPGVSSPQLAVLPPEATETDCSDGDNAVEPDWVTGLLISSELGSQEAYEVTDSLDPRAQLQYSATAGTDLVIQVGYADGGAATGLDLVVTEGACAPYTLRKAIADAQALGTGSSAYELIGELERRVLLPPEDALFDEDNEDVLSLLDDATAELTLLLPSDAALEDTELRDAFCEGETADCTVLSILKSDAELSQFVRFNLIKGAYDLTEMLNTPSGEKVDTHFEIIPNSGNLFQLEFNAGAGTVGFLSPTSSVETTVALGTAEGAASNGFIHQVESILDTPEGCSEAEECDDGYFCDVALAACVAEPDCQDRSIGDFLARNFSDVKVLIEGLNDQALNTMLASQDTQVLIIPPAAALGVGSDYAALSPDEQIDFWLKHMLQNQELPIDGATEGANDEIASFVTSPFGGIQYAVRRDASSQLIGLEVPGASPLTVDFLLGADAKFCENKVYPAAVAMSVPEVDPCDVAVDINVGATAQGVTGGLGKHTVGGNVGQCIYPGAGPETVFRYVNNSGSNQTLCASTRSGNTDYDTMLYVRAGAGQCADGPTQGCNDNCQNHPQWDGQDSCIVNRHSSLTINAEAGETYFIFVDGPTSELGGLVDEGQFELTLSDNGCYQTTNANSILGSLQQLADDGDADAAALIAAMIAAGYESDPALKGALESEDAAFTVFMPPAASVAGADLETLKHHVVAGAYDETALAREMYLVGLDDKPFSVRETTQGIELDSENPTPPGTGKLLRAGETIATGSILHRIDKAIAIPDTCDGACDNPGEVCVGAYCIYQQPGTCGNPTEFETLTFYDVSNELGRRLHNAAQTNECGSGSSGREHVLVYDPEVWGEGGFTICVYASSNLDASVPSLREPILHVREVERNGDGCSDVANEKACGESSGTLGIDLAHIEFVPVEDGSKLYYIFVDAASGESGQLALTSSIGPCSIDLDGG